VADFCVEIALCDEQLGELSGREEKELEADQAYRRSIKQFEQLPQTTPANLIRLARVHARIGGLGSTSEIERTRQFDLATQFLRDAVDAGYQNVKLIRAEPAFASLQSCVEFQTLIFDLTFPENPFEGR
jgi:hypothetical protein